MKASIGGILNAFTQTNLCFSRKILTLIFLTGVILFHNGYGQDLEKIGDKKPLKVSGGINVSNVFYAAHGIDDRRDPFSYFLTGNISFDLYGWVVPLSFTHSNQHTTFQQPFNQYSIHPTYKSVTAHIGYTSMTFSPYSLNGHLFKGVGIDFAPKGRFKVSAMYGRLQQAVQPDTLRGEVASAAFRRMGYGVKASYQHEGSNLDLSLFRAKDEINSISFLPDSGAILPEENLVLSIAGGKTFFKKVLFQVEFASSAITRDTRAGELNPDNKNIFSYTNPLYTQRISSSYYNALKTGVSYQGKSYTIGLGYERIEPEYRTLGAYYFNNDFENVTVNATKALLKGKLNLAANAGMQGDNLDRTKISTMKRFVGSVNIGYAPSERLNLSGSYSNFNTYTNIRSQFININQLTPYDNLDTLNYTQLSQSANMNMNYNFKGNKNKRQSINVNMSVQDAKDEQGGLEQPSGSRFYNINSAYHLNLVPSNLGISLAFNINQTAVAAMNSTTLGPTIGIRKSFFDKKLGATATTSMNNLYTNGDVISRVVSVRVGGNYSIKKKHHLNIGMIALNRKDNKKAGVEKFTEFTGTLGYSYSF